MLAALIATALGLFISEANEKDLDDLAADCLAQVMPTDLPADNRVAAALTSKAIQSYEASDDKFTFA